MLIIVGIILSINLLLPDKSYSYKEIEYKTVTVLNGDTLWSIAKEEQEDNPYYTGKDVRDIIYDIVKINNLKTSYLKVNQKLEIPIY